MKAKAVLDISLSGPGPRKALSDVLAPDNEGLPPGLSLSVAGRDNRIVFTVESRSPAPALSTIMALLRDVVLFQEVWLLSRGKNARGR